MHPIHENSRNQMSILINAIAWDNAYRGDERNWIGRIISAGHAQSAN
jgi:hypothetical protein